MTYGDEQEAASEALTAILRSSPPAGDASLLLACRRQAQLAIDDRIRLVQVRKRLELPARARRTMDAAKYPVELMADVRATMPSAPLPDLAPSEILAGPAPRGQVALWQAVARHLTVGNADLRRWADEPLQSDKRRWHLIVDLALILEGLVIADQGLADAGLLPARTPTDYAEARLAMSNVARVVSWRNTDPAPDHAIPDGPAVRTVGGTVISVIRRPEDYAFAQRSLAQMLRPLDVKDAMFDDSTRHGLQAARVVAAGQIRLANVFTQWAARVDAPLLATRFRDRITRYDDLDRAMMRLVERRAFRSPHVVNQQSEMVRELPKYRRSQLSIFTLAAIDEATRQVAVNLGRSLRPEALARRNVVVFDRELGVKRPITNSREPFVAACRRLADERPINVGRAESRRHRDRLAAELAIAPPIARW